MPEELTVHPLGRPLIDVAGVVTAVTSVAVPVPTHGYTDGVDQDDVLSACVPSNGNGWLLEAAVVTAGETAVAVSVAASPLLLPSTLPPVD